MELTHQEQQEKERLRDKQASTVRPLFQEEYERLEYLNKKEFHNSCSNIYCTGYEGTNPETTCPVCNSPLLKLI